MSVEEVGEVGTSCRNKIYWVIPSFSLLSEKKDTRIWSALFDLCDNVGILLYTEGVPEGFVGLDFLGKDGKQPPVKCILLGIADMNNSEICRGDAEWTTPFYPGVFKAPKFVSEQILYRKWNTEKPRFRLFCEIPNNQHCQVASTHTENACELERLRQNFKQLYIGSKDCDLTIQVQDREFKAQAHRAILRACSSVFDAMFTHGFSESNSGIVPIEDSEPDVIEEFLFFVYTGRIQNLSSHNVSDLYYVSDKYNVLDLKEKCISFLKNSLTTETICDVINLARKHNETELMEDALIFFSKHMEEISVTAKWQAFMTENPTEADEISIKAIQLFAHTSACKMVVMKRQN